MHAELSDFAGGTQGGARIVAAPSALAEQLADDIGAFCSATPKSASASMNASASRSSRACAKARRTLGVLWDLSDLSGLANEPYRRDRLCLTAPLAHPLAESKRIAFTDALPQATVSVAPGGMMYSLLQREAARLSATLVSRLQVSSMDAAARIVAAGLGPTILPREAVQMHATRRGAWRWCR